MAGGGATGAVSAYGKTDSVGPVARPIAGIARQERGFNSSATRGKRDHHHEAVSLGE